MRHGIWVGRPAIWLAGAFLLTGVAFSACFVGDQSCAEGYNVRDTTDQCPYGEPGSPDMDLLCVELVAEKDETKCDVNGHRINFLQDVYGKLANNCSSASCHAQPLAGVDAFKDSANNGDAAK